MSLICKNKCRGMALPAAIFVMIILSLLGSGLVILTQNVNNRANADMSSIKAYFAAKAGLEYALNLVTKQSICSSIPQTISFTSFQYLSEFKTTFTCSMTTANESGVNVNFYKINSYGCNGSGASCPNPSINPGFEYVERLMSTVLVN